MEFYYKIIGVLNMNIGMILAGGKGIRMGMVDKPKQFIDIYGKPVIVHTIEAFDTHPDIDYIAIISLKEWCEDIKIWVRKYELNKVKWIIEGGETRQESTYAGLVGISDECGSDDIVVIHDAVRPLVSHRIISDNIKFAAEYGAVDTVIPSADTIVQSVDGKTIHDIPVRRELYIGQTPQSFRFSVIKGAHEYARKNNIEEVTDDCKLVLRYGEKVYLVQGDKLNVKITTLEDLLLVKSIIKMGKLEML